MKKLKCNEKQQYFIEVKFYDNNEKYISSTDINKLMPKFEKLVEECKKTRNKNTHYLLKHPKKVIKEITLYDYSDTVYFMYTTFFM